MFDQFKRFLESIILIQTLLLVMFLLFNFDSLTDIKIGIAIAGDVYTITVNLIVSSLISLVVFVTIIVVVSLNILGSGVSEIGVATIARFMALIIIFAHFLLAETWIFGALSYFGSILSVMFRLADIMYFIASLDNTS
jgi:hypothetical protein